MLIGQFEGKIGEKSRVAFPKRFRAALGDTLIVTLGFENALVVVSETGWKELVGETEESPFTTSSNRETKRFILGGATFVELDEKGRFILPEYLKNYAQIKEDVIFLGLSKYVEIWDKSTWQAYQENLSQNITAIAEKLTHEKKRDE